MSVDRAELILENGVYGQKYVDPYPALNEYGGILVVNKTANGDYITSDSSFAWLYSDFPSNIKRQSLILTVNLSKSSITLTVIIRGIKILRGRYTLGALCKAIGTQQSLVI